MTGSFLGLGLATINAGGSVNGGGALTFGKDITIGAGAGITLGGIQGAGLFTATSVGDMSLGATTAVGNVTAKSTSGSVTFGGDVQSGGNVAIRAARDATVTGAVSSMGTVNVAGTQGNVKVAGVSSNGDTTMSAGQTLTLSGTSTVAGQCMLSGGNVTLSGSQGGSKNVAVTAQGTLDASQASMVSTGNMQLSGTNVTLGDAVAGGALTATASNQLSLAGSMVDAVGAATLTSQNGLYNASNVLAGGALDVSAPNLTNAANASLASTTTTTINATNFTNAGLVNGSTTNVTVAGGLNNTGGSLMGVNSLSIGTGSLNNQNGMIFAGNPDTPDGPTTGDVSLTITGADGSFANAGGQLLAQRNLTISAANMAFDPSQGTISQGGQLSITAASVNNTGTWNYGGQGVTLTGLNGINNYGTMTGVAPLTLNTNGTFTNSGQVTGYDVTFNGALNNVAGAVMHADDVLTLNGNTTNRGVVEAGNSLSINGGNYDNQSATTQSKGNLQFSLTGTLQNTTGTISAAGNITINAGAVVNDGAGGGLTTTTQVVSAADDPSLYGPIVVGTQTVHGFSGGNGGSYYDATYNYNATLADLGPDLANGVLDVVHNVSLTGMYGAQLNEPTQIGSNLHSAGVSYQTIALPGIDRTITAPGAGAPGTIIAGGSINMTAGSLSNANGIISAGSDANLNLQSLSNGSLGNVTATVVDTVDQAQLNAFMAQLHALGTVGLYNADIPYELGGYVGGETTATFNSSALVPPSTTSTTTTFAQQGLIVAGEDVNLSGGNLVNSGNIYAGRNFNAGGAQSFSNQGQRLTSTTSSPGCATGVSSSECASGAGFRGGNPTTTNFGYTQQNATIYAGNDLVIAAGQVSNTYGNLLAGHDIVIGGVGTSASSTTPAQSLTNTSGNIEAGNNITLDVSGAITNTLPPPVPVHQDYGSKEQYSGCMTAGGYRESYCEGYVDQQSGSTSVISAGHDLQINAGSLTNIGSLIAAGSEATISVAGPVVNEAQTLNAYWHSHWVQETGLFSADKRHDVWACGSVEECTALYGSAYTSTGGTIDPPQPVGNIAATIQAPNLTITSGGQIQNVGNVIGTSVSLSGQKLINGITTANTYTPSVAGPSQVISLSPVNLPGISITMQRQVSGAIPAPVAGTASYVDSSLGTSTIGGLGPQDLLNALPGNLQPGSTLFYYSPQEEDLALQQAALQQTGKASFIDGLTDDSKTGASVTEQEKNYLYQNALDYAKANNLQLGEALTQTQVSALDKPMLWYVEQTVPDPSCMSSGSALAACGTVTALMPQVYLPAGTGAQSAGGNISGTDVTLDFGKGEGGSVLNTGSITASGTLAVNTDTLTNQANQVDIGQVWSKIKGGYVDTTGTTVQPGGFMSAADMSLNVQTLNQIGGALQKLNADGTVDYAGTQQMLAALQQQLGTNFTQTSVSDNLHTDFVKDGGGLPTFVVAAIAIAASIVTAGAAAAAMGATMATMTLGESIAVGALSGMAGSAASQLASGGGLDFGALLEAGAVGAITAGLTNGITYNSTTGSLGLGNLDQGLNSLPQNVSTLGQMAGISNIGNALSGTVAQAGESAASSLPGELVALGATATISAGVQTGIEGGSFLNNLEAAGVSDLAAAGAFAIGNAFNGQPGSLGAPDASDPAYVLAHAALGCASSAALGTGCAGGAIGGAASAIVNPLIDSNGNIPRLRWPQSQC